MNLKILFIQALTLLCLNKIHGQVADEKKTDDTNAVIDMGDSTAMSVNNKYLLNDSRLQLEITDAVNNLYNFKFPEALKEFKYLKYRYEDHPLPYFLIGLTYWWNIVPNSDIERYDERMFAYLDSTIYVSEKLLEKDENNSEVIFFLAASYAFKGRLHSERKNWTRAAYNGKSALNYFERCKKLGEFSPELMFGDGLYNYYSIWIPENYPWLKPFLAFLKKGDKQLGLEQLKKAGSNAFYTRIEAQYFLMRILDSEEKNKEEALVWAKYLHTTFPDNPYFHRYYVRLLYTMGYYIRAKPICEDILMKIENKMPGYEETSGRYASFFLGQIVGSYGDVVSAKKYYNLAIEFSSRIDALNTGYCLYSMLSLGDYERKEKNFKEARAYYKRVKKLGKSSSKVYKKAKQNLQEIRGLS